MTGICYSQANVYISIGVDIKSATFGTKYTNFKPKPDLLFNFGMIGGNTEVGFGYESFTAIDFSKYFFNVAHHFPLYLDIGNTILKPVIIASIEPTIISRDGMCFGLGVLPFTWGGNLAVRYELSYHFSVELECNALARTDLCYYYPKINPTVPINFSDYFKILYRL
jgi:hypothetical protein